jgi:hypothetical protein
VTGGYSCREGSGGKYSGRRHGGLLGGGGRRGTTRGGGRREEDGGGRVEQRGIEEDEADEVKH